MRILLPLCLLGDQLALAGLFTASNGREELHVGVPALTRSFPAFPAEWSEPGENTFMREPLVWKTFRWLAGLGTWGL